MLLLERRGFQRLQVSLVANIDLNGVELEARAINISRGGAFLVCNAPLPVVESQPVRIEVHTEAGKLEINAVLLGPRDPLPPIRSSGSSTRFGFAIRFEVLDSTRDHIFESILDGLGTITVSLKLHGLGRLRQNQATKGSYESERRVVPRVNIVLPVLAAPNPESVTEAQSSLYNLSATGACLEVGGERAAIGDRLTLKIPLPHRLQAEISNPEQVPESLTAQIMWSQPVAAANTGPEKGSKRFLVGVRFLHPDTMTQRRIARCVGHMLIASERFDQGPVTTEAVELRNELGQRIAGYLDLPKRALPESPVVIISPGYGESKHAYVTLGYYLADNGFDVVRYDHCNHIGESDGDTTNTTLSGFKRGLQTVLDYVKETRPGSPIAVIASGLSGRVALKTAATDDRIDLLLILTGVLDLQLTCLAVHQEDLIVTYLRGARRGISNLLGLEIDADRFLQDAIKEGYADLRTTLRDAERIHVPVIFFATHDEAGVPVSAVNEVRAALGRHVVSQVFPIPQALHQLHQNPRKEWAMFRQLVSCCIAHLSPAAAERQMVEPAQLEIGRQNRLERQRAKDHRPIEASGTREFWANYLDHFHCLANIPEYWRLLDQISRLLGTMEDGATILDAGCGFGSLGMSMLLSDLYRRRGASEIAPETLRYVGMEVVHSALAQARLDFSNLGKAPLVMGADHPFASEIQTSLTCADLNRPLPFRDNQFDRVICNLVLGYLEDPMSSLQELLRVLAPGGRIVVTSLKPYADLIEIYRTFVLRTDLPEEIEEAERLLNTTCKIKQAESDGVFRSFQPDELTMMLAMSGVADPRISSTFGNQAYIVVGEKSAAIVNETAQNVSIDEIPVGEAV
jgi:SAM-dependent methyltransferase/alpha-beta hydrolase superfamily lysophospholipase